MKCSLPVSSVHGILQIRMLESVVIPFSRGSSRHTDWAHLLLLLLLLLLSCFSRVRLCATHRQQPTRLLCPWDSPGKNTGVGCHFLLQCMKVKSESEVAQSCLTLSDLMDCSPPGFSVHGTFQARVPEWGAIAFSASIHSLCFMSINTVTILPEWKTGTNYLTISTQYIYWDKESLD